MTDPLELVGRLEILVNPGDLIVGPHMMRAALEEAAACIREMVERIDMLEGEVENIYFDLTED